MNHHPDEDENEEDIEQFLNQEPAEEDEEDGVGQRKAGKGGPRGASGGSNPNIINK